METITYDGARILTFSSAAGTTSARLAGALVGIGAGTAYTVFWRGRHFSNSPFEIEGNYVYNIGGEINHQRELNGGVPQVEVYDGITTFTGDSIAAYDDVTTVFATVYDGSTHASWANGNDLDLPGTPSYSVGANPEILIGAFSASGYNFNGELTDLIIFDSALGASDRALIQNYLEVPEPSEPLLTGAASGVLLGLAGARAWRPSRPQRCGSGGPAPV